MSLKLIRVKNLRNIASADFEPLVGVNIILGKNGSGKTSLLEAVYLLGKGRSFRSRKLDTIISKNREVLEIFGIFSTDTSNYRVGLQKSRKGTIVKINGDRIDKLSKLAGIAPVHIITPQSNELLERGSELRRRFIEWGVFHVEHSYQSIASRYHRALSQRNAALKSSPVIARSWNGELIENGLKLNEYRRKYLVELSTHTQHEVSSFLPQYDIGMSLKQGWPDGRSFDKVLEENFNNDVKFGFTRYGPHRADLKVKVDGLDVKDRASRGELKMLVACMVLAQTEVINQQSLNRPILLVDDFSAELDEINTTKLFRRLSNCGYQVFMTSTEFKTKGVCEVKKMFHVEHGVVTEISV